MHLLDFDPNDRALRSQMAALLVAGFRDHWPDAWPDLEEAESEVDDFRSPERLCRVAVEAEAGAPKVLGWVGGLPEYDGRVWELHPLVVAPAWQGRGIGRALVQDFEARVRERGGLTILLGSDDEDAMTSLGGVDLYPDPWVHIRAIRNFKRHPYEFYQKLGFAIVGVVPDANGFGRPDILMAKRVGPAPAVSAS